MPSNTTVTGTSGNLGTPRPGRQRQLHLHGRECGRAVLVGPNGGPLAVDTFTVTAADGTTKHVSFTINGTNDAR